MKSKWGTADYWYPSRYNNCLLVL